MTKAEFLRMVETAIEVDEGSLKEETVLADCPRWDSMGILAFIAALDENLDILLDASRVTAAKTAADLVALVDHKLS